MAIDFVGFTGDGRGLYLVSSVGANASRLLRLDVDLGETEVIAEDSRYDVGAVILHPDIMYDLESDSNIKIYDAPSSRLNYLGMSNSVAPLNNVAVRQAISYAVPYDTILNEVLQGYGKQLTSPIPDGTPYHTDEFFQYKVDYDKAKALLAEAGFPEGFEATFEITTGVPEAKKSAV